MTWEWSAMSYDDAAPYNDEKIPLCPTCYRRLGVDRAAEWDVLHLAWMCPHCQSFV